MTDRKAMAALETRAKGGDADAMLEYGQTLGRDHPDSLGWMERAQKAGCSRALVSLGWAWEKGFHGASIDLARAVAYYDQALAAGHLELGPTPLGKHVQKLKAKLKRLG